MTKAQMIETICEREARAWFALIEQEYNEAPRTGNVEEIIKWSCNDITHLKLLYAWSELNELLETFHIEPDYENPYRKLAHDYTNDLYKERTSHHEQ